MYNIQSQYAGVMELADVVEVTGTSMSVHNGFMLWTLILLFNFIRYV